VLRRLLTTTAPAMTLLIRLMVGAVFVSEGIQKFLYPDQIGSGRFAKIGLPAPDILGPFVGSVEILSGTLVLLGLGARLAAVLATTKCPILVDRGFWAAAHEARTDWSMLLGSLFLLIDGAGPWSIDAKLSKLPGRR